MFDLRFIYFSLNIIIILLSEFISLITDDEACITFLIEKQILYNKHQCQCCRKMTTKNSRKYLLTAYLCKWEKTVFMNALCVSSPLLPNTNLFINYNNFYL